MTVPRHPWKRIQTQWAFKAWSDRNPEERNRVESRYMRTKAKRGTVVELIRSRGRKQRTITVLDFPELDHRHASRTILNLVQQGEFIMVKRGTKPNVRPQRWTVWALAGNGVKPEPPDPADDKQFWRRRKSCSEPMPTGHLSSIKEPEPPIINPNATFEAFMARKHPELKW